MNTTSIQSGLKKKKDENYREVIHQENKIKLDQVLYHINICYYRKWLTFSF